MSKFAGLKLMFAGLCIGEKGVRFTFWLGRADTKERVGFIRRINETGSGLFRLCSE